MIKIYINNTELKLNEDTSTVYTQSAAKIEDEIKLEHSDFFEIPAIPNIEVFKGAHFIETYHVKTYDAILQTANKTIPGKILAKEFTNKTIKIAFTATSFQVLKDTPLREIDMGSVTLASDVNACKTQMDEINDETNAPVRFPIINILNFLGDNGKHVANKINSQTPAWTFFLAIPYITNIIENIFHHTGYQVYGAFLENFKHVLLYSNKDIAIEKRTHYAAFIANEIKSETKRNATFHTFSLPFEQIEKDSENLFNNDTPPLYEIPTNENYIAKISFDIYQYVNAKLPGGDGASIVASIKQASGIDLSGILYFQEIDSDDNVIQQMEDTIDVQASNEGWNTTVHSKQINATQGNYLKIFLMIHTDPSEKFIYTLKTKNLLVTYERANSFEKIYPETLYINSVLPDIQANDFFNEIRKFFGIALFIDPINKKIELEQWTNILNAPKTLNITEYVKNTYKKKSPEETNYKFILENEYDEAYVPIKNIKDYQYIGEFQFALPSATKANQIALNRAMNIYYVSDENLSWNFLCDNSIREKGEGKKIKCKINPLVNRIQIHGLRPAIKQEGTTVNKGGGDKPNGLYIFNYTGNAGETTSYGYKVDTGEQFAASLDLNQNSVYASHVAPYLEYRTTRPVFEIQAIFPAWIQTAVENCLMPDATYRKLQYKGKTFIPLKIETEHKKNTTVTKITMQ